MAAEMRVYFTGYVARGRLFAAPLGTPLDAPAGQWVDCGPAPEPLAPLIAGGDVYAAEQLPRRHPPRPLCDDPQPQPGALVDQAGRPLLDTTAAEWPLWSLCRGCTTAVRQANPQTSWQHAARCQHCASDIVQLAGAGAGGNWVSYDGFTVCAKAPAVGAPLLVHKPMPAVT